MYRYCHVQYCTISSYSYRGKYSRDTSESNISSLSTLTGNTSLHSLPLKLGLVMLGLAGITRSMQEVSDVGGQWIRVDGTQIRTDSWPYIL